MYVWFDALANYITALDYAHEGELYRRYWLESPRRIHVIGKGIIRFHAVYWPAWLLAAGVPLPTTLFVHGYYTVEGRKMGKSMGNALSPITIVDKYGSDAARYYFLAATHPTADSDFSLREFGARYNADLANDLGNLVNRTISMIRRYRDGVVPGIQTAANEDRELLDGARSLRDKIAKEMEDFDFQGALAELWTIVGDANRYIETQAPWKVARLERDGGYASAGERMNSILGTLARLLHCLAIELRPFLPSTAARILEQLGLREDAASYDQAWGQSVTVAEPQPIFPRLDN